MKCNCIDKIKSIQRYEFETETDWKYDGEDEVPFDVSTMEKVDNGKYVLLSDVLEALACRAEDERKDA